MEVQTSLSCRSAKADQEKMGIALQRLAAEDPSFRLHTDEESGQTIISRLTGSAPTVDAAKKYGGPPAF